MNLQKAGHSLFLSQHHDPTPADLLAGGAVALANPKEVTQEAEFIIVMVPDTPQVDDVLFRADGVAAGVGAGKVVIDMSSISPSATKAFAARINEKGAQYLDAPRSEEHTSELQSLMRISYAVFCLKKKITNINTRQQ